MPKAVPSGNQIRQTFVDFFEQKGHTFVPSSSLVPGGDQTLLFTNAGMVQFKDVFLGTDQRPYSRAANSQKCMRVAGKHNDLEDVGQDDTHHTFFEMLGNWSFGDYYKEEAIAWAWELLTEVWNLPKDKLWATCFEDEQGEIPRDDEAAEAWIRQAGFLSDHVLFFGRKDNFWEMAETGPCGPNSEIHLDRGPAYCDKKDQGDHICAVNGDCQRYLELWNLVFIQYNRLDSKTLETLPAKHVDTGMGFERIVSVLQDVDSNYRTDLLLPLLDVTQQLTGHSDDQREEHLTPYRVIADHGRAAAFLIADGVTPGNTGRNYVCRMIIRRAARFGSQIGLHEPFLAEIAASVIENYGEAFPELAGNRAEILGTITLEEEKFQDTLEGGLANLDIALADIQSQGLDELPGEVAFDLYATYGLPLEITRDIVRERNLAVDQDGFEAAMAEHRRVSGGAKAQDDQETRKIERYQATLQALQEDGILGSEGVYYDPYGSLTVDGKLLAIFKEGTAVESASAGDLVEVLLPATSFYLEAGGQVADTGKITSLGDEDWAIEVDTVHQPAAGVILHIGQVRSGNPRVGDLGRAEVDQARRLDIMRNHTATHLLHAELRTVLGDHARQKGSLVAPDRLRFDFRHPQALTTEEKMEIEAGVNRNILANYSLLITYKPLQQALKEGVTALFGEKYGETVRTITIGDPEPFSYELCGGTHLEATADIGVFLITSESSVGSGIRRLEAVTGRGAYQLIRERFSSLETTANILNATLVQTPEKAQALITDLNQTRKERDQLHSQIVASEFDSVLEKVDQVGEATVLAARIPDSDAETLRNLADNFRRRYPTGVVVLASVQNGRPILITAVTDDLIPRGLHAGELVSEIASVVGGGGGGKPSLAQAGGKDASKLDQALEMVPGLVEQKLHPEEDSS